MKQSSEAKNQNQLALEQLWTLIIPQWMRLSSSRGTLWQHLSCFNSGPKLPAQTQSRNGPCAAAPVGTQGIGETALKPGCWAPHQTGQGEPPGDPQAAGRGNKSCFECTYTWLASIWFPPCFWKNPDQDVLLSQWQHSCQQDTYWFAWCLFACCARLLPLGISIQFYPLISVYFVSGCTRHLTVQYASEAVIPQKTKGLMED